MSLYACGSVWRSRKTANTVALPVLSYYAGFTLELKGSVRYINKTFVENI